jgi:hypothetical protein
MMTGTVARGGCRTSAGRVRLWGRGRAARGARARGLSEAARARPDARARKATCGRGARRSRASIRRHFDVVNQVYGREKGTACARGSRTARGGDPPRGSERRRARRPSRRQRGARRLARRTPLPARASPARPPRRARKRAAKRASMAPGRADLSCRGAYLLRSRRARREGARARFCVPESARGRFSPGLTACARARAV